MAGVGQSQAVSGTAGSGGAQKGSATYSFGAAKGAGVNPKDSGQLTKTHTDYRADPNFPTHTTKQMG